MVPIIHFSGSEAAAGSRLKEIQNGVLDQQFACGKKSKFDCVCVHVCVCSMSVCVVCV